MAYPPVPVSCSGCGVTVWRWSLELPTAPVVCGDCGPKPCPACGGTGQGLPTCLRIGHHTRVEHEVCKACQGSGKADA